MDTWTCRELPVLTAVVRWFEEQELGSLPEVSDIAPRVELGVAEVFRAFTALHPTYLDVGVTTPEGTFVRAVHDAGRRAVGQWPSPAVMAECITAELEAAAQDESPSARRVVARQMTAGIATAGRELFVDVLASAISRTLSGG